VDLSRTDVHGRQSRCTFACSRHLGLRTPCRGSTAHPPAARGALALAHGGPLWAPGQSLGRLSPAVPPQSLSANRLRRLRPPRHLHPLSDRLLGRRRDRAARSTRAALGARDGDAAPRPAARLPARVPAQGPAGGGARAAEDSTPRRDAVERICCTVDRCKRSRRCTIEGHDDDVFFSCFLFLARIDCTFTVTPSGNAVLPLQQAVIIL